VPDDDAAAAMYKIRKRTEVPIVADIHFHYKLALKALDAGIDKLRINPGNIGSIDRVREVVRAAEAQKVPIRIGVNGGSLEKDLLKKYGTATPEAMVESGMRHIKILEDLGFGDIIISLKASDVNPNGRGLSSDGCEGRLPIASRCDGSGHAVRRNDQIGDRSWRSSARRDRRHDPCFACGRTA
jgi:hypothetical protein